MSDNQVFRFLIYSITVFFLIILSITGCELDSSGRTLIKETIIYGVDHKVVSSTAETVRYPRKKYLLEDENIKAELQKMEKKQ